MLNAGGANKVEAGGVVRDSKVVHPIRPCAGLYPLTQANVAGQGSPQAGEIDLSAVTVPLSVAGVNLGSVGDFITAFGGPDFS